MRMKKLIGLLFVSSIVCAEPPSAGWNFGTDTYGQHASQLVLNSLSDRYGLSTYQTATQSLGTNDYIEENGVKNQLAINGYTQAYDYNPNSKTGYGYNTPYTTPLPANVPLTKLTFMGLDGDPTATQDVYVLTSEYNRLSDQGQADSIDSLNAEQNTLATGLSNETNERIAGDQALQNQINQTNQNVSQLDDRVNNLERLKVMPEAAVRIYDSKYLSMEAFDDYDATNGRNFAVGMKATLKIGKSYEERRIDEQDKKIRELEILVSRLEDR